MMEEEYKGVIAMLDNECMRPGDVTDLTLLTSMDTQLGKHKHYRSFGAAAIKDKKGLSRNTFHILHYAGEVEYSVAGFIDCNKDLLFRGYSSSHYIALPPWSQVQ